MCIRDRAHTTYIIGGGEDRTEIWENLLVNTTIRKGHAIGEVSGDISGTLRIYGDFSLRINSGTFAGYEFGFREWGIYGDSETYFGISTWFHDPESDKTYIAMGGDIAAIGYSIGDGIAEFDLARIGDTQRYGNFIYQETNKEYIYYNKTVLMDFETERIYAYGSGYYNGEISSYLFDFYFKDPDTHDTLIDPQVFFYTCDWGNGTGFSIALSPPTEYWWLGGISSPLYGVIGNIVGDGKPALIEHAVPLPSTLYLLGSGLFGILVIRKKRKKM